jgi:RNA polymerase sigma-70 factor, ECF subfamily
MHEPGDDALLRRSAIGDRDAFDAFARRHQGQVFRYLRASFDTDVVDVEDALQETFLAAWKAASAYRGGASARGWLFAIARNAMRARFRRRQEVAHDHDTLEALGLAAGWGRVDEQAEVAQIEAREVIDRGLAALGPDDREILLLRDWQGMSGDEVCALLELSLPAMKSRLHRARLRFCAAVGDHVDG